MPLKATAQKNTDDNLRNAIIKNDMLKAMYIGTQYESMFDEIVVPDQVTMTDVIVSSKQFDPINSAYHQ
jgi:hypothetical protein